MKNSRQLCAAVVLALALSAPAWAGQISTGKDDPPPPQPASASLTEGGEATAAQGQISTGYEEATPPSEVITGAAFSLLQAVLSLV
jgi:hypothetical protein